MDSRYEKRGLVYIKNGCKFPLGNWKEGEKREFISTYFYNNKRETIRRLLQLKKSVKKKCRWSKAKLDGKILMIIAIHIAQKKSFTKIVSHSEK